MIIPVLPLIFSMELKKLPGQKLKNYKVDLKNFDETLAVFQENEDIEGIIHFAAYKAVGESVEKPLDYYENNLFSLVNVLKVRKRIQCSLFCFFLFMYGIRKSRLIPVTEESPVKKANLLMELLSK